MAKRSSRAAAFALTALLGCAHAQAPQPAPSSAPPSASSAPAPAPTPEATAPAQPAAPSPHLEESEVITPDELASIPDPVAGSSAAPIVEQPLNPDAKPLPVAAAPTTTSAPPLAEAPSTTPQSAPASEPQSSVPPSSPPQSGAPPAGAAVWRVQVFASPDRAQAERVARASSQKLGTTYVLAKDGDLVKVRLGSFVREEDAQALKERAVQSGYTGAFRVLDKGGS